MYKRITDFVVDTLHKLKTFNGITGPKCNVFVIGSGRSGTTWLGNIVAGDELITYFEPFDYRRVSAFTGLGLRPYFRPNDSHSEWKLIIDDLLCSRLKDDALANSNNALVPRNCRGILIKDIRINGILMWLQKNFDIRFVFILRHPCAVALSRVRCNWVPEVESFFENKEIVADLNVDINFLRELSLNPLFAHLIMWCFENAVPLRQFGDSLPLFRYENLMTDKETTVPAILATLGLSFNDARQRAFNELSNMSTRSIIDPFELIHGWRKFITDSEINTITKIIRHFELSSLYEIG